MSAWLFKNQEAESPERRGPEPVDASLEVPGEEGVGLEILEKQEDKPPDSRGPELDSGGQEVPEK